MDEHLVTKPFSEYDNADSCGSGSWRFVTGVGREPVDGDPMQNKVSRATVGATTVTATVFSQSMSVQIVVCAVSSLSSDACEVEGGEHAVSAWSESGGDVTVTANMNTGGVDVSAVYDELIHWSGGRRVADAPDKRVDSEHLLGDNDRVRRVSLMAAVVPLIVSLGRGSSAGQCDSPTLPLFSARQYTGWLSEAEKTFAEKTLDQLTEAADALRRGEDKVHIVNRYGLALDAVGHLGGENLIREIGIRRAALEEARPTKKAPYALISAELAAGAAVRMAVLRKLPDYSLTEAAGYYRDAFTASLAASVKTVQQPPPPGMPFWARKSGGSEPVVLLSQAWGGLVETDPSQGMTLCPQLIAVYAADGTLAKKAPERPDDSPDPFITLLRQAVSASQDYGKGADVARLILEKEPRFAPILKPDMDTYLALAGRSDEAIAGLLANTDPPAGSRAGPKTEAPQLQKLVDTLSRWRAPMETRRKMAQAIFDKAQTAAGFATGYYLVTPGLWPAPVTKEGEGSPAEVQEAAIAGMEPRFRVFLQEAKEYEQTSSLKGRLPELMARVNSPKAAQTLQQIYLDALKREIGLLKTTGNTALINQIKFLHHPALSELQKLPRYQAFCEQLTQVVAEAQN